MKKIILSLSAVFICGSLSIDAQNIVPKKRCYFEEHLKKLKESDPMLESQMQALETSVQEQIKNNQQQLENSRATITIPVVMHIITNTGDISDARVQEQMDVLNQNYGGLNTHPMSPFDDNLKANTGVQFCLAKRDQTGKATTGIERRKGISHFFCENGPNDDMKHYSSDGLDQWDPTKYMNIWVCNTGGNIAGFAGPPTGSLSPNFGLVVSCEYFGITGTTAPFNEGCTATHELAHSFFIYHLWGDPGNCATDYCADTPPQNTFTEGTASGVKTDNCSPNAPGIMYMNFMDYTDDNIMANFTPNQAARMQAIFASGQKLHSLSTSTACSHVSIEETENIQNINIYPSPTSGKVNINFSIINPCDVNVSLHNIIGAEIYSFNKTKASVVDADVDISNQSSGIYFVKIKTENQSVTQKITLVK